MVIVYFLTLQNGTVYLFPVESILDNTEQKINE